MSKAKKVCVIIPAYNEGTVVRSVVKKAVKTFSESKYDISVIVINDGSKDSTSIEATKGGAFVINHILNSGQGSAVTTGFKYAEINDYDILATMDGDDQHDAKDVLRGIEILEKDTLDLLVGSRLIDNEGMSRVKVIGNRGLGFITYLLFGVASTDSQSGLRIYSRNAIENLHWESTGYEFCSEILWRAKQQKMAIGEYSIKTIYTEYSKKKGQNNWNAINIVKNLLKKRIAELF